VKGVKVKGDESYLPMPKLQPYTALADNATNNVQSSEQDAVLCVLNHDFKCKAKPDALLPEAWGLEAAFSESGVSSNDALGGEEYGELSGIYC
jgi:hypothetical protein